MTCHSMVSQDQYDSAARIRVVAICSLVSKRVLADFPWDSIKLRAEDPHSRVPQAVASPLVIVFDRGCTEQDSDRTGSKRLASAEM